MSGTLQVDLQSPPTPLEDRRDSIYECISFAYCNLFLLNK